MKKQKMNLWIFGIVAGLLTAASPLVFAVYSADFDLKHLQCAGAMNGTWIVYNMDRSSPCESQILKVTEEEGQLRLACTVTSFDDGSVKSYAMSCEDSLIASKGLWLQFPSPVSAAAESRARMGTRDQRRSRDRSRPLPSGKI